VRAIVFRSSPKAGMPAVGSSFQIQHYANPRKSHELLNDEILASPSDSAFKAHVYGTALDYAMKSNQSKIIESNNQETRSRTTL
jgi:hypothetical protein